MEDDTMEFKDDFIESVLKNSNRKSPSADFENRLMKRIHHTNSYRKEMLSRLKKSMVYCFIGLSLVGFCSLALVLNNTIFSNTVRIWPVLALFLSIIVGVGVVSNYKRFFESYAV